MEILVPTSIVLFFLTGAAWPTEMTPSWVSALGKLSPATLGAPLFIGLNQMGASLSEVIGPLTGLAILAVLYIALTLVRIARYRVG
jgi:ABC-2 type transport system permease protein